MSVLRILHVREFYFGDDAVLVAMEATYIRRQAHRYRTSSPRTALALRALLAAVAPPTPLRIEHPAAM